MKDVLVLRLSALGDVIHTIPAVTALKEQARVRWVVEAPYRELVELVAGVEAIPVRLKQWARSPSLIPAAIRAMRGADTSIDFQGLIKSAMLGWVSGAKERIGFDKHAIREKPALLFTNHKIPVDTTKHVIEQNLQLALGVRWQSHRFQSGGYAAALLKYAGNAAGTNDIVILPGTGKPNKIWPVDRWREVAKRTNALIAWGPGERALAESIGGRIAPPTNLRELAALLRSAKLVLGGDTGPLHLAAALGTPVIGLYGPTSARRNGPYGQLDRCIQEKSMDEISVEAVMKLIEKVAAG